MASINSVFGSSFNESFDFQGLSSGAMETHNRRSHLRSRERSPHESSSRDSNREEGGDLKENRHLHFPHLVPREADCLPGSSAKVLKIYNNRILLQTEIRLAEVNTRMPGIAPVVGIIPPVSTVSNLPVTVSWIEG